MKSLILIFLIFFSFSSQISPSLDADTSLDISTGYSHVSTTTKYYFAILASNDLHGHFYPEDVEISGNTYSRGGLDYLAKYAEILKGEFKNRFIYIDAGDLYQGSLESSLFNGDIMTEALNSMQCKASTFGLHEFDYSREELEQKIKNSNFEYIAANIYDNKKKTKNAFGDKHVTSKVYTVNVSDTSFSDGEEKSLNGEQDIIKLGIVGLARNIDKKDIKGSGYEDIEFLSYKSELISEIKKLRKEQGCHGVILLANIGLECEDTNNKKLNMYTPTTAQGYCDSESELYKLISSLDSGLIDGVIAGQSHKQAHHWVSNVPVISSVDKGYYANVLYLHFKWNSKNKTYEVNPSNTKIEGPIPICEKVFNTTKKCEFINPESDGIYSTPTQYLFHKVLMEPVTSLSPIHDKYDAQWEPYREKICEIIGTNKILENENNGDFYLGNILAEIQTLITGAQISIFNTKLLSDTWNPGKLPKYKIKNMINFESNLCTFTMTGREVLKMMSILQSGDDKYYSTNGIKQIMTKDESNNYILTQVKLFDGYKEEEIILQKEYTITTIDELIKNGKSDFKNILSWYQTKNLKCDYGDISELVENYLKALKIVDVRKYKDEKNPKIKFL